VATANSNDVVTLTSEGSVDQLLRRAVAAIETHGLDVVAVIDHSGEAHDVGLHMPETKLVLFGSPAVATRLLLAHPDLGLELPLKLLISERDDGNACVSYNAPDCLARVHRLPDDEADDLRVVETIARATGNIS
jgi:uncharacterized protein (DUF302 family)